MTMCTGISEGTAFAISLLLAVLVTINLVVVYRSRPNLAVVTRRFSIDDDTDDDDNDDVSSTPINVAVRSNTDLGNVSVVNTA